MTAPLLGALGLVLSLIVPGPLARARWPAREPRAAVVLWQGLTLASLLAAVGVVLAAPEEIVRANGSGRAVAVWALLGTLAVATLIVLRLLLSLIDVTRRSRARRDRHRMLVDLLDRAEHRAGLDQASLDRAGLEQTSAPGVLRILDGSLPFAYCLPGRSPRVVLSGGALQLLAPAQVAAVLAHEQAHLRARHDVVMESFTALYRALPGPLRRRTSLDAVHLLLEMLADDGARRRCGPAPLREALAAMGGAADALVDGLTDVDDLTGKEGKDGPVGRTDGNRAASGRDAEAERRRRLERLGPGAPGPSAALRTGIYLVTASVLVLPTVMLVVPWLSRALPDWPL